MAVSPIDQFAVKTLGSDILLSGIDISFTNAAFAMVATVALITLFFYLGLKKTHIVPHKMQLISELSYDFIFNMVKENIGDKAKKFLPLIYTIFMFFLFGNLVGMIPYSFAFTSHIIVTITVSLFVLLLTTIYGIYRNGFSFLKIFTPSGVPMVLMPLMIVIEFLSYIAKSFSMAVRLFANIMASHIMIEIIAGFVIALGIFGIIPFSFTVVLYLFELAIAFLQAYIFSILTCLFLAQAFDEAH